MMLAIERAGERRMFHSPDCEVAGPKLAAQGRPRRSTQICVKNTFQFRNPLFMGLCSVRRHGQRFVAEPLNLGAATRGSTGRAAGRKKELVESSTTNEALPQTDEVYRLAWVV